jgi:hypothetical protein
MTALPLQVIVSLRFGWLGQLPQTCLKASSRANSLFLMPTRYHRRFNATKCFGFFDYTRKFGADAHASKPFTTRPETSVKRKSLPA